MNGVSEWTCSPDGPTPDVPDVVHINEYARVIQLTAGPVGEVAKEDLPDYLDDFAAGHGAARR